MEVSAETLIDDILTRSLRLETPTHFRVPLDLSNILQSSKKLLSKSNLDDSARIGQLLLSQQKIDISQTPQILDSIDPSRIVQKENLSFSGRCQETLQTSIVNSILQTSENNESISSDDFIFHNLSEQLKSKEINLHRALGQHTPASIPFYETDNPNARMELSPSAVFYHSNVFTTNNFAKAASKAVRSSTQSNLFTNELQRTLSDTFMLVDKIKSAKTPIQGSLQFLEHGIRRCITNEVNTNLRNANRGGIIGIIPTIKAYIKLQRYKFGNSVWAPLYFALRSGSFDAALQYLVDNPKDFASDIATALTAYTNRAPLTGKLSNSLNEYLTRETTMALCDPFKALTLAVLTRNHIIPENDVIVTTEDWLWLRMQFIEDLTPLQEELRDFMPQDRSNPFQCGQLYLLIGLYEKAARWFILCEENIDDCLHIVISMQMANLVSSQSILKPLLLYSKDVFRADPVAAVRYLSLLSDRDVRIAAIAKLAVDLPNGEIIFHPFEGSLSPISQILRPNEQHEVMHKAAQIAERRDQHGKAARLYGLAGNFNMVIDLECIELSQCIEGFVGEEILGSAIQMYQAMLNNAAPIGWEKLDAMRILIHFAIAAVYARKKLFQNATDEIEKAELLPTSSKQIMQLRETLIAKPELKRVIPATLEIALQSYSELYLILPATSLARAQSKEKGEAILDLTSVIEVPEAVQRKLLDLSLKFQ